MSKRHERTGDRQVEATVILKCVRVCERERKSRSRWKCSILNGNLVDCLFMRQIVSIHIGISVAHDEKFHQVLSVVSPQSANEKKNLLHRFVFVDDDFMPLLCVSLYLLAFSASSSSSSSSTSFISFHFSVWLTNHIDLCVRPIDSKKIREWEHFMFLLFVCCFVSIRFAFLRWLVVRLRIFVI